MLIDLSDDMPKEGPAKLELPGVKAPVKVTVTEDSDSSSDEEEEKDAFETSFSAGRGAIKKVLCLSRQHPLNWNTAFVYDSLSVCCSFANLSNRNTELCMNLLMHELVKASKNLPL